jgi:transcriptional regulator with XRE-family HTH domain
MPKQPKGDDSEEKQRRKEVMAQVAHRLKTWRESTGQKQLPLARRLGMSHQRWYHYESGRNELDLMVALQLCEQEGLTMDFLYRNDLSTLPERIRSKYVAALAAQQKKPRQDKKHR